MRVSEFTDPTSFYEHTETTLGQSNVSIHDLTAFIEHFNRNAIGFKMATLSSSSKLSVLYAQYERFLNSRIFEKPSDSLTGHCSSSNTGHVWHEPSSRRKSNAAWLGWKMFSGITTIACALAPQQRRQITSPWTKSKKPVSGLSNVLLSIYDP